MVAHIGPKPPENFKDFLHLHFKPQIINLFVSSVFIPILGLNSLSAFSTSSFEFNGCLQFLPFIQFDESCLQNPQQVPVLHSRYSICMILLNINSHYFQQSMMTGL